MLFCCEGEEDDRILHIDMEKTWKTGVMATTHASTIQRGAKGILLSDPPFTLHLNAITRCYSLVNASTGEVHVFPSGHTVEVITTEHVCVYQKTSDDVCINVKVYSPSDLNTPCFAFDPLIQVGAINLFPPVSNCLFAPQIDSYFGIVCADTGTVLATFWFVKEIPEAQYIRQQEIDKSANRWCPMLFTVDNDCQWECNSEECNWDGGLCSLYCALNCLDIYVGDGGCNPPCYFPGCDYDDGDCNGETFCADGCASWMIGNGNCDTVCQTEACLYDSGDCVSYVGKALYGPVLFFLI
ncbi:hypothetical protein Pelo_17712 [Pelomyxa schiedti]|nr:hypothetical protein Pelo_17712 [Pelomyxa schiedti]